MKKPLPTLLTDEEAEDFVANSDLTEYDLSNMQIVQFRFKPASERVSVDLPRPLVADVKETAAKAGVSYEDFIRPALEAAVVAARAVTTEVPPAGN